MSVRSLIRKNLIVVVLLIFVYTWYFLTHATQKKPEINTLGAQSDVYVFTQPESGRSPILSSITNAQNEILVEVYLLTDKEILQALEEADHKGVRVKVMAEEHPFGGGHQNSKSKTELEQNGVEFEWTSSSYSLTHEKSIIIDGKELFVLNQNLTASSFSKNREYDVLVSDKKDIEEATDIFNKDWERLSYSPTGNSNLIASPVNSRKAITDLIESAKEKIVVEVEVLEDKSIVDLLLQKSKSLDVRIIVPPEKEISSNKKAIAEFKNSTAQIRELKNPYPHAKLILVDNQKAYVGSINLSKQSMDENRELGIILTEPNSIVTLYSTFEKDWATALPIN